MNQLLSYKKRKDFTINIYHCGRGMFLLMRILPDFVLPMCAPYNIKACKNNRPSETATCKWTHLNQVQLNFINYHVSTHTWNNAHQWAFFRYRLARIVNATTSDIDLHPSREKDIAYKHVRDCVIMHNHILELVLLNYIYYFVCSIIILFLHLKSYIYILSYIHIKKNY